MALSANQVEILIWAQDKATAVIKKVSGSFKTLVSAAKSAAGGVVSAFNSITSPLLNIKTAILGLAGGFGFASLTRSVLQTGGAFEDYKATLKTVLGTQEAANKSFQWITEFAQKTPFEVDNLTQAFVRLAAYGIKGEKVLGTLGDTAAAMGKDIMQAVEALADAQTGEFERLKEFGVKAIQVTKSNAAQLHATLQQVGETALAYTDKNGKEMTKIIDRNNREQITSTLMAIWNERYQGAMEERSKTMNGMLSNLADAWTNWKNTVAEMVMPQVKDAFQSLLDAITNFSKDGTLTGWANGFAQIIKGVTAWITGFVKSFEGAFHQLGLSFYSFNVDVKDIEKSAKEFGWSVLQAVKDIKDWMDVNGDQMWAKIKSGAQDLMTILRALASSIESIKAGWIWLTEKNVVAQASYAAGQALSNATYTPASSGTRASGGGVSAGQSYLVGEKGPEMFTPNRSGVIGSTGGQTVINNIYTAATAHGINNALASRPDTAIRSTRVGMTVSNSRSTGGFNNLSTVRSR